MLSEDSNNYITCIYNEEESAALIFADISTGEVHAFEESGVDSEQEIITELSRFKPVEILINGRFLDLKKVNEFVTNRMKKCQCEMLDDERFDDGDTSIITEQFGSDRDDILHCSPVIMKALCAMFGYFGETQGATVKRFVSFTVHKSGECMGLNLTTRQNLEISETMRTRDKRTTLMGVLDKTVTGMGRRRLQSWVEQPLIKPTEILERLDAVEELTKDSTAVCDIRDALKGIYDLERLMTRVMFNSASPRDI